MGAGNCSTAGPVLLHEFANPAPGSLPARWRGLTWCPRPPPIRGRRHPAMGSLSKTRSRDDLRAFKFGLGCPLPAPQSKPLHGPSNATVRKRFSESLLRWRQTHQRPPYGLRSARPSVSAPQAAARGGKEEARGRRPGRRQTLTRRHQCRKMGWPSFRASNACRMSAGRHRFARDFADRTLNTRRWPASKRGSHRATKIATLHTRRSTIAKRGIKHRAAHLMRLPLSRPWLSRRFVVVRQRFVIRSHGRLVAREPA